MMTDEQSESYSIPVKRRWVVVVTEARSQAFVFHDRLQILRSASAGPHLVQRAAWHRPQQVQTWRAGRLFLIDWQAVGNHTTALHERRIVHLHTDTKQITLLQSTDYSDYWIVNTPAQCTRRFWSLPATVGTLPFTYAPITVMLSRTLCSRTRPRTKTMKPKEADKDKDLKPRTKRPRPKN